MRLFFCLSKTRATVSVLFGKGDNIWAHFDLAYPETEEIRKHRLLPSSCFHTGMSCIDGVIPNYYFKVTVNLTPNKYRSITRSNSPLPMHYFLGGSNVCFKEVQCSAVCGYYSAFLKNQTTLVTQFWKIHISAVKNKVSAIDKVGELQHRGLVLVFEFYWQWQK